MRIMRLLPLLLAVPFLAGWTFLGDNILGRPYDYVTVRTPTDDWVIKFRSSDGKWIAGTAPASAPLAHKTSHENNGSDEISVAGLSGLLADAQTPLAHKTSHQDGGADEISVLGLSGLLADAQKVEAAEEGTLVGTRKRINFIGAGVTAVDNSGSDRIDVMIPGGGGTITLAETDGTPSSTASVIFVNSENFGLFGVDSNVLQIKTGGVTETSIGADAVTSAKVKDGELVAGDFATATVNRLNPTPANVGAIPVDAGAGSPYTSIDGSDADTSKALFATGASATPAFRVLAVTDIDELLASSDLTDFSAAKTGTGSSVVSNTGPTIGSPTISDYIAFIDAAGSPGAAGRFGRNGANLEFHDGTAARVMEKQSNKNAANGYAGLDGSSKLANSQMTEVMAASGLSDFSGKSGTGNNVLSDTAPTITDKFTITGQAGAPGTFTVGTYSFDTTKSLPIVSSTYGTLTGNETLFTNTNDIGTLSDSGFTSLTSFGTICDIKANAPAAGRVIRVSADILHTIGTNASQALSADIQIGGTTVVEWLSNPYATSSTQTNTWTHLEACIFVRAAGAGGSVLGVGTMASGFNSTSPFNTNVFYVNGPTSATSIDFTADRALTIRFKVAVDTGGSETATLKNAHVAIN